MNVIEKYKNFCINKGITFEMNDNVKPYDETTLFCPAGMQKYKTFFKDDSYNNTISNIQSCIRMNDINEIGDGSHLLYFNMIGFFSFREKTIKEVIYFWMEFLEQELKLKIDYITIHSNKMEEWKEYYKEYDVEIRIDDECIWSDGDIGGYCTEFYIDGIEIGNIVNPLNTCIDVGFGLERLEYFINGEVIKSKQEILKETILKIIYSGYKPSNTKQGYVLRKLLRLYYTMGEVLDHEFFKDEVVRQEKLLSKYNNLKDKYKDKSKEWWFDTMGINLDEIHM